MFVYVYVLYVIYVSGVVNIVGYILRDIVLLYQFFEHNDGKCVVAYIFVPTLTSYAQNQKQTTYHMSY